MKGGDTLKRFTEGLLFGAGFAISFTVVWYVAAYVIFPATVGPKIEKEANKQLSEFNSKVVPPEVRREMERPFHEMGPEESIEAASAIALAKYEPAPDGRMKAVVIEFLKKEPDANVPYDIGDEYPRELLSQRERQPWRGASGLFQTLAVPRNKLHGHLSRSHCGPERYADGTLQEESQRVRRSQGTLMGAPAYRNGQRADSARADRRF